MVCICFNGSTTVTTKDGVKRLDEIRPGTKILTSSLKSGKSTKWTQFYTWGHREPNVTTEFLVIKMENGQQLKISKEHMLFVDGEKGRKISKTAGQVGKGDKVFHLGDAGCMELLSVVEITSEVMTGVYAPFTMSGHLLADGFLVGCYGDIEDFDRAHAFMAPLRTWYRLRQSSSKGDANQDGIHGYARKLMWIRESLPIPLRVWVN